MATSKKDYEAVAARIDACRVHARADGERVVLQNLACALGDYFGQDNARFSKERFIRACGFASTYPIKRLEDIENIVEHCVEAWKKERQS
jgi:hypothetical protein